MTLLPGGIHRWLAPAALLAAAGCGGEPRAEAEPAGAAAAAPELRVCADPQNLPWSNDRAEGFENRIAAILADELGATLRYTWHAQGRGFVRNTLRAGRCDVIIGVPNGYELTLTTRPYYRSSYVFVYRRDASFDVRSFDDPVLRRLRIGVALVGDDGMNTPPAHALGRRGIVENVVGYSLVDRSAADGPGSQIVAAVADGTLDLAVLWGPLAGYYARRSPVPLEVVPVEPQIDLPFTPFAYDIAMGVARGDSARKATLEAALARREAEIRGVLREYGVPLLDRGGHLAAGDAPGDVAAAGGVTGSTSTPAESP